MRTLLATALCAATTLVPVMAVAADPAFEANFWQRMSEQRLDRALPEYTPVSTRPAVKIGEVSVKMDDSGHLTDPQMTRSTGEPGADNLLMRAANNLQLSPPPEGVDARTVLLRVAFVTPSGVAAWQDQSRAQRQPFVYVEQAERGGDVVVIGATR